jgi:hypothetical protein
VTSPLISGRCCALLSRVEPSRRNCELGLLALYQFAAFASIGAKRAEWAVEQEFRKVTLVRQDYKIHLNEREAEGKVKRYLPVQVRVEGKWIAFSEIIVGPNRNIEDSRDELKKLLADQGYEVGDIEFPEITASAIPPWGVSTA